MDFQWRDRNSNDITVSNRSRHFLFWVEYSFNVGLCSFVGNIFFHSRLILYKATVFDNYLIAYFKFKLHFSSTPSLVLHCVKCEDFTSWTLLKKLQSQLVSDTATSHVFMLSIFTERWCPLSVKGLWENNTDIHLFNVILKVGHSQSQAEKTGKFSRVWTWTNGVESRFV